MPSGAPKGKKKDITMRENVQQTAIKMVPGLKNLSYSDRLKCLKLPTLAYCHLHGVLIETFKIIRGVYDSAASIVVSMAGPNQKPTPGHPYKLYQRRTKMYCRQLLLFTESVEQSPKLYCGCSKC